MGSVCREGSSCCFGCSSNGRQSLRCPCKDVGLLRAWPVGSGGGAGYGSVSSEKHSQLLCRVRDWLRGGDGVRSPPVSCVSMVPCSPASAGSLPAPPLLSRPSCRSHARKPSLILLAMSPSRGTPSLLPSPPFLAQDTSLLSQPECLCFGKLRTGVYSGLRSIPGILGNFDEAGILLWPCCPYLRSLWISLTLLPGGMVDI